MKQIYGLILIAWLATEQIRKIELDIWSIAFLLGLLCLFIIKERFLDKSYATIVFLVLILVVYQYNKEFALLAGIPILDFSYSKKYPLMGSILAIAFLLCAVNGEYDYIFFLVSSALFGYVMGEKDDNERNHISVLDEERRLRYRLEQTQNELINSKKEIEHLTQIKERNRIAHEIHDNVGHSIAGVIFQIEAAKRIMNKDKVKLESILELCSSKLSEALELTRNTVYNIKVDKKMGLVVLEKMMDDFKFCPIIFEHSGDFSAVSVSNMTILEANIMEFLTNASKYSQAKNIKIKIDIGKKSIRLYYKDDGIGCKNITENLGISGMRGRVRNSGGTISICGNDGFLIVLSI